jgi:serpin B
MLALSVTANGAAEQTRKDMEIALGGLSMDELNECLSSYVSALPDNDKHKLLIANSIWMKDDGKLQINEEFLERVWAYYKATPYAEPFDGETLKKINEWVSKSTDGMIESMLDEISDDAVMYLINAICFDAQWSATYNDYQVTDGYFTDVNGNVKKAEMLSSVEGRYLEDENAIGFMKPYAGGYTFVALLPKNGMSVYDYIASLDSDSLMSMLREPRYLDVNAKLPMFSCEYSASLNDVLSSMGMASAFAGNSPDFTKMGTHADGPLAISNVLHKTYIEVTQYGTRAGASTVVEMTPECVEPMPSETKNVVLDRPFVYLIVENNTKLPVFMGAVTEMDQKETVGLRDYVAPTRREYVRIDGCGDLESMLSPVMNEAGYIQIDSTDELDALSNILKSNDEYFMLDSYSGSFIDMYAGLNSRFFEENSLIFVYVTEGSGSIHHRIDACYIDSAEDPSALVIELCAIYPEIGTDDMAGWLIGVGLPKDKTDFGYVKLARSSEMMYWVYEDCYNY